VLGVYPLADGREGQIAVPHLTLTFGATGMALDPSDGGTVRGSSWTQLEELSLAERSVLPDGRDGIVILVVERGRRPHRFVLPTDDGESMEAAGRGRATQHGLRTSSPRRAMSRAPTVSIVLVAAALLTLLLLSAVHVIRLSQAGPAGSGQRRAPQLVQ
jgi:hypothetical protein